MLTAKPEIDLSGVRRDWNEWVNEAGQTFDDAIAGNGSGRQSVAGGIGTIADGLQELTAAARRTSDATEGIADHLMLGDAVDSIGDVKDILEKTGVAILGMSQEAVDAAVKVGDLAEKGASLGKNFGPWGALIGAVGGALVGAFANGAAEAAAKLQALNEATQRATTAQRDLVKAIKAVRDQLKNIDATSLAGAMSRFDALTTEITTAKDSLEDFKTAENDLNIQMNKNAWAGKANTKEQVADRIKINEGIDATEKKIKELEKVQADVAATLKQRTSERTKADTIKIKTLEEMNGKELKAEQDKADGRIKAARGAAAQIQKLNEALDLTPAEIQENAKAAADNNKVLVEAQEAYDKASQAIETFAGKSEKAIAASLKLRKENNDANNSFEASIKAWDDAYQARLDAEEQEASERFAAGLEAWEEYYAEQNRIKFEASDKAEQEAVSRANNEFDFEIRKMKRLQEIRDNAQAEANKKIEESVAASVDLEIALFTEFANILGSVAVKGVNLWYDSIANGEKRSAEDRKRARAEFARDTGTKLITDGFGHVIAGAANSIRNPGTGTAEIVAGAAEMGIGFGLGGVGAFAQRRLGGTQAKVAADKADADAAPAADEGTKELSTIVIAPNNDKNTVFSAAAPEQQTNTTGAAPVVFSAPAPDRGSADMGTAGVASAGVTYNISITLQSLVPNTERQAQEIADQIRALLNKR